MRAINLLPKQAISEPRAGLGGKLPFVGSAAVPVLALILVIVGYSSGQLGRDHQAGAAHGRERRDRGGRQARRLGCVDPRADTSALVVQRTQRLAALQSVLGNEVAWDTTLLNVARVLPANVWLTSLTAISPTPADAVAPAPAPPPTTTTRRRQRRPPPRARPPRRARPVSRSPARRTPRPTWPPCSSGSSSFPP